MKKKKGDAYREECNVQPSVLSAVCVQRNLASALCVRMRVCVYQSVDRQVRHLGQTVRTQAGSCVFLFKIKADSWTRLHYEALELRLKASATPSTYEGNVATFLIKESTR